jgi:hypothetical protein
LLYFDPMVVAMAVKCSNISFLDFFLRSIRRLHYEDCGGSVGLRTCVLYFLTDVFCRMPTC